jgi:hypothetical protein
MIPARVFVTLTRHSLFLLANNCRRVSVTRRYWFDPARMRALVAAQPRWDLRALRGQALVLLVFFVAKPFAIFVARPSCSSCVLVRCRWLYRIDDDHVDRTSRGFQLEAQLFPQCRVDGQRVVRRRSCYSGGIGSGCLSRR